MRDEESLGQRVGRGVMGLIMIAIGIAALGANGMVGLVLLFIGALLMYALANSANTATGSRQRRGRRTTLPERRPERRSQSRQKRPPRELDEAIHRVATTAIYRAGNDPEDMVVKPVDTGMLVYDRAANDPMVYREGRVPDDSGYVRPFAVLRTPRHAKGKVRFEMVDANGTRRFIDESEWELREGETFIYPETWLPLHNIADFDGRWKLRIFAAGVLLGVHSFRWRNTGGGAMRAMLDGDGEIQDDLRGDLSRKRLQRLSLEELLSDQEGGAIESDPEVEAALRQAAQQHRQRGRR